MSAEKRPAPDTTEDQPEQKKPAACAWGGASTACAWGSSGGCAWGGSGGSCSGFAAVASSGGGFGSAPSSGFAAAPSPALGSGGFASFSGGATATTFAVSTSPHASRAGGDSSANPSDDSVPAEPATTGEEDETCVYRVRAKLFRLEVRLEPARPFPAIVPEVDTTKLSSTDEVDEAPAAEPAAEPAAAPAAAPATAPEALASSAEVALGAEAADASKPAADDDEEDEGGDDEDDDDDGCGVSEATTKATDGEPPLPEPVDGPMTEVTRWVESGVGQLRLLVHKPLPKGSDEPLPYPRLVMRVELVHRLILNEPLLPSMAPAERVSDTSVRFVMLSASNGQPQSYLLRVKLPGDAEQLLSKINANIPKAEEP